MKIKRTVAIVLALSALLLVCKRSGPETSGKRLAGIAEDLWGNQIDLSQLNRSITLIEPFSPSYCGYCMLVGEFVTLNYFHTNAVHGGMNVQQCLFSPQRDIYAYMKYYRDTTSVLTYPVSLHDYHRDGYPAMLAFRDGEQILKGFLDDYGVTFKQRAAEWWPEAGTPPVTLASGLKMAENYMIEARSPMVVTVIPDDATRLHDYYKERFTKKNGFDVKYECELTEQDCEHHLEFVGETRKFRFDHIAHEELPFAFDSDVVRFGAYSFPKEETGLLAVAPNPYNREKYVRFELYAAGTMRIVYEGWVDFCVWRYDSTATQPKLLLDGRFAKEPGCKWRFADSLSVAYENLKGYCEGGVCPVPSYLLRPVVHHDYSPKSSPWRESPDGRVMILGNRNCRLPSIAVRADGTAAIAWEEQGDIVVALTNADSQGSTRLVEDGEADAYNPQIVWDGSSFLIVYLCDRDGWYHLYGRFLDGDHLSDEIRLSGPGTYEVITPALASNGAGQVVAAWSEWKANLRYPRYCMITGRTVGKARDIAVIPDGDDMGYINAWGFSLAVDRSGRPFGMWNQHYPSTLCACGGPLDGPVTTPQKLTGNVETSEIGEYPSTALDPRGAQWATWSSNSMETYAGKGQRILVSRYDSEAQTWVTPYVVSEGTETHQNQTPHIAIVSDGSVWVVWSGRSKDGHSQWGIYLTKFSGNLWSPPILISEENLSARAPEICLGPNDKPWVSWHAGIGENMTVRVWTPK
ncbi:MAG: hypothetical protein AB1644_01460 [Candidatus Zixiibacteriota bacterium]